MRILITGSSGQVGTNLALRLLEEGHFVFGIDKRPNSWTDDIPCLIQDLSIPYHQFKGGIGHLDYPPDLDVVIHLAAHAKVHELVQHPARALENITMTFNVLEFCRHHNVPLVYSSSREVYGDIHRYTTEESQADFTFTESPYSASKISGEALVYSYAQCYGLRYIVFRFSNVYGRYDNDIERMERVIPLFIGKLRRREPVTIYGRDKLLDFTYIDDCVSGVCSGIDLLSRGEPAGHTVNLAYGEGNSLIDLSQHIGRALNIVPQTIIQPSRTGEVTRYVADIRQATKLLGYRPQTPLDKGVPKAVSWCLDWSGD
jgi:UDP-glucuronate 4-epimerase